MRSARPRTILQPVAERDLTPREAEEILQGLAGVFTRHHNPAKAQSHRRIRRKGLTRVGRKDGTTKRSFRISKPDIARWSSRFPAVVFMAYLDRGIGEAYVSPQIEAALGFSQEEWLEDPVRWYSHIHPDDKQRWSAEAAEMFLTGNPLRSAYRVVARDGRVIWFHCEAKMIRKEDGEPWFIHGVGFDITDLKRTEEALQEERNVVSGILDTVGALVVVLDPEGAIMRFNRACEQTMGYSFAEVAGQSIWDLFLVAGRSGTFQNLFQQLYSDQRPSDYEGYVDDAGRQAADLIAWSSTVLPGTNGHCLRISSQPESTSPSAKHLEKTILEISAREQRRIGQDLHDGLGPASHRHRLHEQSAGTKAGGKSACPKPPTRPKS